jgi:hypothetical protein
MARRRTQFDPARWPALLQPRALARPPARVQPIRRIGPLVPQPPRGGMPGKRTLQPPRPIAPAPAPAPVAAPTTPVSPAAPNLPLDPLYEQQRRGIEDQLAAQLAAIGVEREQIPAITQLLTSRMATQQEESTRQLNEGMNARGLYNSGIRTTDLARSDLGYERQRQDLAMQMAERQRALAQQEAEARAAYQSQLMEALLGLAERTEPMGVPTRAGEAAQEGGGLSPSLQQQAQHNPDHGHGGPNSRNHHGQRHTAMHSHPHRHAK